MSRWTPSIVPNGDDQDVYLVVDDFGRHGRAWCEADIEATDLETVTQRLLEGQYNNPLCVVSFNTAEKWSRDVSEDIAHELRRRCDLQMRELPASIQGLVETHEGHYRPRTGVGALVGQRWHEEQLAQIDKWRRAQPDMPGRAEAIRRLVELGLKAKK